MRRLPALPVVALVLLAFWDSWRWLVQRTWTTPEEAVTLIGTVGVIAGGVGWRLWRGTRLQTLPTLPVCAGLLAYAGATCFAPPIARAAIAVAVTLAAIYAAGHHRAPPIAFWGLCCLVLPIVPTLQFYLGYPMRVVSAMLTVPLLRLNGLVVTREGTTLVWNGERIAFDAPCSGVTMAWAGVLLVLAVATIERHGPRRVLASTLAGLRFLLIANVLRAASLFHIETGTSPLSGPLVHQAVGLVAFAAALLAIGWQLRRSRPCPV